MFAGNYLRRGQRGGMGFRGASPPWPYVGLGRGGLPRGGYYFRGTGLLTSYQPLMRVQPGYRPLPASLSKEEELNYLKEQAEVVKSRLDEIDSRMRDLESKG